MILRSGMILLLGSLTGFFARGDWMQDIHSADSEIRWKGVNELQTLDDPRISAACLPLLQDEGVSTRRQAARAIGSRFKEMGNEAKAAYLQQLEEGSRRGPADITLIAQRAIGLLTKNMTILLFL